MSDIVERLRNWRTVHLARLHLLMEEAADEIERLRADWPEQLQAHSVLIAEQELEIARLRLRLSAKGDFPVSENAAKQDNGMTLTAAEREAVAYYLGTGGPYNVDRTLVELLSRTGTDGEKTADDAAECHSQSEKTPERERITDAEREAVELAYSRLTVSTNRQPPRFADCWSGLEVSDE